MKILILTDYDRYGGVAIASVALQEVLSDSATSVERFQIHTMTKNIFGRLLDLYKAAIYLRHNKADKVILMHLEAIVVGLLCWNLKSKTSFINVIHTDLYGYYVGVTCIKKVFLRIMLKCLKNSAVVFVSVESELRAKRFFGLTDTRTIYNIVALPNKLPLLVNRRSFVFGCVSRLHPGKNIDLIIRIFNSFWLVNKDTKLLVFGDGSESVKLMEYAKKFPCFSAIYFKGHVVSPDEIYSQIDGLVSFSSMEGFPLVMLEALLRNIPVLHSDCSCGPREILFPNSNPFCKTSTFEIAEGGVLVKIPERVASYAGRLQDSEEVMLEAFCLFYQEFNCIKKTGLVDVQRFGTDVIRKSWVDLLLYHIKYLT